MASEIHGEDLNPVTEVRKRKGGALVIERTHATPVTKSITFNIAELEAKIAKYDAVIATWQARKAPLVAIIDEYMMMDEGDEVAPRGEIR